MRSLLQSVKSKVGDMVVRSLIARLTKASIWGKKCFVYGPEVMGLNSQDKPGTHNSSVFVQFEKFDIRIKNID